MDIYLGACFIFAFLSMVKLAIVKYMGKKVEKREKRLLLQDLERSVVENCTTDQPRRKMTTTSYKSVASNRNVHDGFWVALKVFHIGSQLVLPLAFVAFALFYFFVYPHVVTNYGTCFPSSHKVK